jgi:hypothetical protein
MHLSSVLVVGLAANAMAGLLPLLLSHPDLNPSRKHMREIEAAKNHNNQMGGTYEEVVYMFPDEEKPADYDEDDAAAAVKYIIEKYPELFDTDKTRPSGKDKGRDFPFELEPGERISQHEEIPLGKGQVAKIWQTKFDDTVREGPKRESKEHHFVHSAKLPKPKDGPKKNVSGREGLPGVALPEK